MNPKRFLASLVGIAAVAVTIAFSPRVDAADDKVKVARTATGEKILDAQNLDQLRAHRGEKVAVEGKIERQGESKNGNVRFLDFKKDYREGFVLVFFTWKSDGKFTKEKLAEYLGKKVRATGKLTEYGSTMQIEVESLDQLQIVP
jgi:type II secretory pathway pseudopilin PulG